MADLGHIGSQRRRRKDGSYVTRWFVDLRPWPRIWGRPNEGGFENKRDAERVLDTIREELRRKKPIQEILARYLPPSSKPLLIPVRIEAWLAAKRGESKASDISPTYLRVLEHYAQPDHVFDWWRSRSIHEITTANLDDWSIWLRDERELSKKSRRNVLGAFRSFVGWLRRREEIAAIPIFPEVPTEEHEPVYVSSELQDEILNAIDEPARGIFLCMARLGIRPGEARALRVCDYEPGTGGRHGWIHVRKAMKGPSLSAPMREPKTKRSRSVPVPEDLADWLMDHPVGIRGDMPLFRNPDPQARDSERRWSYQALDKRSTRATSKVGVKVSLYQWTKHSMATQAVSRGVDVRLIQEFPGHADIRSTGRYAKVRPETLLGVLRPPRATSGRQSPVRDLGPPYSGLVAFGSNRA